MVRTGVAGLSLCWIRIRKYWLRFGVEWKGKNLSTIEIAASGNGMLRGVPDWAVDVTELNLLSIRLP
jgi:hypothetical protein